MTTSSSLSLSSRDRGSMEEVQQLARGGAASVAPLIGLLGVESWVVRRAVVAALARIGTPAIGPLCALLSSDRAHEARLAAAVDALVASLGDVERAVLPLASAAVNPAVICDVAQILGRRKSSGAVRELAAWCGHADDNVAVAAIEALGRIGGSAAVLPLIEAVESSNFFRVFPAMAVLGQTRDVRAVRPLAVRLFEAQYATEAAAALGETGQLAAIAPLVGLLMRDRDLVRAAARALTRLHRTYFDRFGDPEAVPVLMAAEATRVGTRSMVSALDEAGVDDAIALATVLGWMRDGSGVAVLLTLIEGDSPAVHEAALALRDLAETAEPAIREAIRHGDSAQRLRLLPFLSARRSVIGELTLCLADPEPAVRAAACDALGRIGDPSTVGALFALLPDPDGRVALAALGAVQSLGSDEARSHALLAARSPDPRMRCAALRVISYFAYPEGIDVLLEAIVDDDERMRDAAAGGLALLDDPRASEALIAATKHASGGTRAAILRALGSAAATDHVVDALVHGLGDGDAWVRYYACQSLGRLHVTAATEAISALMFDIAGQVRVAAVEAIAKMGGSHALAVLDTASHAQDVEVRRAALLGLAVIKRPDALPILLRAAASEDPTTRLLAITAITDFDTPDALAALSRAVTDVDPRVRDAAFRLLAVRPGTQATRWLIEQLVREEDRERALTALATAVDGRIEGILATLEGASSALSELLVQALIRMRRANANAALEAVLLMNNVGARRAAATALAAVRTNTANKALLDASTLDPDPEVRRIAAGGV